MYAILSDQTKFETDNAGRDETSRIEDKIREICKRLHQNGVLSQQNMETIVPVGTQLPQLYGSPKTHKPGVPMRPILSMCNSPQHQLARWLVKLLHPILSKSFKHSMKDTFHLIDCLESLNSQSKKIISLCSRTSQ